MFHTRKKELEDSWLWLTHSGIVQPSLEYIIALALLSTQLNNSYGTFGIS